jgi:histidinol phosphatase-like PHP family hydrolase
MKPEYDFHIHTILSGHADSRQSIGNIIKTADKCGLKAIAITEHITKKEDIQRIKIIRDEIKSLAKKCKIYVGAEIDADPYSYTGSLVINEPSDLGLDLVIGSIHYFPNTKILPHGEEVPEKLQEGALKKWRKMLLSMLENNSIDILAHPGIMIANSILKDEWTKPVLDIFCEAAYISKRNAVSWEINELTAKKLSPGLQEGYWQVFKIASDAGVSLTYGSDSHKLEDIGACTFAQKLAIRIGNNNLFEYKKVKSEIIEK